MHLTLLPRDIELSSVEVSLPERDVRSLRLLWGQQHKQENYLLYGISICSSQARKSDFPIPAAVRLQLRRFYQLAGMNSVRRTKQAEYLNVWSRRTVKKLICTVSSEFGLIPRPEESYRLWCVVVCDINFKNEAALARVRLFCQREVQNFLKEVMLTGQMSHEYELHYG